MDDGSVGLTEENKTKENTQKYKINKIGLPDVFCTTGAGMVNAVNTWINKIKEDEQYQKTIRASVNHFQQKMAKKVLLSEIKAGIPRTTY
jgi:hypothetical protein